jgi:predicted alpha/beta-hydrolase family hydrolase
LQRPDLQQWSSCSRGCWLLVRDALYCLCRAADKRMTTPLLLFAPGAGAPSSHPWMRRWTDLLSDVGVVRPFNYPYMLEGRKRPDRLPQLIEAHREALQVAREVHAGPLILIGKSMGSRIGCHVALEEQVAALICFGYPLCGGGDRSKLRDQVLRELTTPILFVQGTRDPLCPLDLLESVRSQMRARSELYLVEEGDHSLAVTKKKLAAAGENQHDVDQRILRTVRQFVQANAS